MYATAQNIEIPIFLSFTFVVLKVRIEDKNIVRSFSTPYAFIFLFEMFYANTLYFIMAVKHMPIS